METSKSSYISYESLGKEQTFYQGYHYPYHGPGPLAAHFVYTGTIQERKQRREEVITDITNKWAGRQRITGPLLMIPYTETIPNEKGITAP